MEGLKLWKVEKKEKHYKIRSEKETRFLKCSGSVLLKLLKCTHDSCNVKHIGVHDVVLYHEPW